MACTSIEIIYAKEMRALINKIKQFGLSSNGIIFGGMVRDEIIGCHYRNEFFKNNKDKCSYWIDDYCKEYEGRLIIPNDMDIYFKKVSQSLDFINKVKLFVGMYGGKFHIGYSDDNRNLKQLRYIDSALILTHSKLSIEIIIGRTMRFSGIKLKFTIDILSINENLYNQDLDYRNCVNNIEPPFHNLDFLCNIFIMEKINGKVVIRPSNTTGTPIDKMGHLNKIQTTAKIMLDIINFKTEFARNVDSFNAESINCFRILKMISRNKFNWNITNLPFKIVEKTEGKKVDNENCCICLDEINSQNNEDEDTYKFVEINTNKSKSNYLHFGCFISYLKKEQLNRYVNPISGRIECRCPFRNSFNFKDCYKSIDY